MTSAPHTTSAPAEAPQFTVFDPGSVALATFLGSPLAGGCLLAWNARRLKRSAGYGWIAAGIGLAAPGIVPGSWLPSIVSKGLVLAMCVVMWAVARLVQGAAVKEHVRSGGRKASRWAAAGIGLISLVVVAGAVFAVDGTTDFTSGPKVALGPNYLLYYRGITRQAAEELSAKLEELGYTEKGADVFFQKDTTGTSISLIPVSNKWNPLNVEAHLEDLGRRIARFHDISYPLHIRLLVDRKVSDDVRLLRSLAVPGYEVYYYGDATEAQATGLAQALKKAGFSGMEADSGRTSVFLGNHESTPEIVVPVRDGEWDNPSRMEALRRLAADVAPAAGGTPLTFCLADAKFSIQGVITIP